MVVIGVDVVTKYEVEISLANLYHTTQVPALESRVELQRMTVTDVKKQED